MQVTERAVGTITVLTLKGRLVLEEVETPLRQTVDRLIQEGRLNLVLNLRDVSYIDSAGLGFLVAKYLSVQRRGGDIKLVHLTPRSSHVLEITHLARIFESFDSEEDAVASFRRRDGREDERVVAARAGSAPVGGGERSDMRRGAAGSAPTTRTPEKPLR